MTNKWNAEAGYKAIFLTVDAPYLGRRLNEYRNLFSIPSGTLLPNLNPDAEISLMESSNDGLVNGKKI